MKKYLILGGVFLVMILAIVGLAKAYLTMKEDRDRVHNNLEQYMYSSNKIIALNKQELRKYLSENHRLDSLLKAEKIKPAKVEWVTEVKHYYHVDTVEVQVGEWAPDGEVFPISYDDKCLSFSGRVDVSVPSVKLDKIDYEDSQAYVGYLKRKKTGRKFLWIFPICKKVLELHVDSECGESEVHHIQIKN